MGPEKKKLNWNSERLHTFYKLNKLLWTTELIIFIWVWIYLFKRGNHPLSFLKTCFSFDLVCLSIFFIHICICMVLKRLKCLVTKWFFFDSFFFCFLSGDNEALCENVHCYMVWIFQFLFLIMDIYRDCMLCDWYCIVLLTKRCILKMSEKGKNNKIASNKNTKDAGGASSDAMSGHTGANVQNMRNSQGENVCLFPTRCQNNAVRQDMGGINKQQYQQNQHQLYNPQQSKVISGQPWVNTGVQGQQWMGQQSNGLTEMVQQIHQTNMNFLFRLSSIEKNVAKLVTTEQDLSRIRYDVYNLTEENQNDSTKMKKLENPTQSISRMLDDCVKVKAETENCFLKSILEKSNESQTKMNTEILELKARSVQDNLLFFGLTEHQGDGNENAKEKLWDFLKNELAPDSQTEVDSLVFDRVHRLDARKMNWCWQPRPIVAKFENNTGREKIRNAGSELNKKTKLLFN